VRIGVVIPWRHEPARRAPLTHVWRYVQNQPLPPSALLTVALGEHDDGPWVKALAVDQGVAKLPEVDVLVIHDADVICGGLTEAIDAVARGGVSWAIPHGQVRRLDEASTAKVLAGGELGGRLTEAAYWGHAGGGIVVLRRDVYEDCPMDPRFVGWGREDDAWALALRTLHGDPWRGVEPCWHLWHPEPERSNRKYGSDANNALYRRYYEATGRGQAEMRALIEEARATTRNPG
jgi:hypothetical protein